MAEDILGSVRLAKMLGPSLEEREFAADAALVAADRDEAALLGVDVETVEAEAERRRTVWDWPP